MKQIIIISLVVIGLTFVQGGYINFDCVQAECTQELNDCIGTAECKKQYDIMNQCYKNSDSACFSKSLLSGDSLIDDECMQNCLNDCQIQTLEGSNVITCQVEQCQIVKWDFLGIFKGQQNRAYFVAWFWFFILISAAALIVKLFTKD